MDKNNDGVPQEFYDVVDQFVNLANALAEKWPTARISSAILYAAARYNAFNFYALDPDTEKNKERAIKYFCDQYRNMLLSNLDELSENPSLNERM